MPFGMVGRTAPLMSQLLGFGDRSTGRGILEGEYGVPHCNQWGLYTVAVRKCVICRSCGLGWCVELAEALLY